MDRIVNWIHGLEVRPRIDQEYFSINQQHLDYCQPQQPIQKGGQTVPCGYVLHENCTVLPSFARSGLATDKVKQRKHTYTQMYTISSICSCMQPYVHKFIKSLHTDACSAACRRLLSGRLCHLEVLQCIEMPKEVRAPSYLVIP